MKKFISVIAFLLLSSTSVAALDQEYLKSIKHVEVILVDDARNACWTNFKESREYAEEKLQGLGATLYENEVKDYGDYYVLMVVVQSVRANDGFCYGAITISLETGTEINGSFHQGVLKNNTSAFTGATNANVNVIDHLKQFLTPTN